SGRRRRSPRGGDRPSRRGRRHHQRREVLQQSRGGRLAGARGRHLRVGRLRPGPPARPLLRQPRDRLARPGRGDRRGPADLGVGASATVARSTFSGNSAVGGASTGGEGGGASGGALVLFIDSSVSNSTFLGNRASGGDASGSAPGGFAIGGALENSGTTSVT